MRNCNGINGVRDIIPSLKGLMIEPETYIHKNCLCVCMFNVVCEVLMGYSCRSSKHKFQNNVRIYLGTQA